MKKIVSLVLALVMLLSVASFASAEDTSINTIAGLNAAIGYPVTDEPIKVTIAVMSNDVAPNFDPETNWMCQYMSRYSGLDITWQVIDYATKDERIPLMLNSGDMPDVIIGYYFDANAITQYAVSDGLFYDVSSLLNEYAPNLNALMEEDPTIKASITAGDGKIYGFPDLNNIYSYDSRYFIQTKWLEAVGKEMPKTLDEFKDVLTAFKEQDANSNGDATDEIPWGASWGYEWSTVRDFILEAYGYMSNCKSIAIDYRMDDPDMVYVAHTERYKDFLKYMNELYTNGLIDADLFTQAESQNQANVADGIVGFSYMSAPFVYDSARKDEWTTISPLVDAEGAQQLYPGAPSVAQIARMVINADVDEATAIALTKFADAMYTPEWFVVSRFGPEADTELDWNGTGHYYDEASDTICLKVSEDMTSEWNHKCNYLTIWNLPGHTCCDYEPWVIEYTEKYPYTAFAKSNANDVKWEDWQYHFIPATKDYYVDRIPQLYFSTDDLARVNELSVPLDDYVATMDAKFITGELSIDDNWDEFQKTLEDYGVVELETLYRTYLAAYKAAQ